MSLLSSEGLNTPLELHLSPFNLAQELQMEICTSFILFFRFTLPS